MSVQDDVDAWHRVRFGAVERGEVALRLLREAVELCAAEGLPFARIVATAQDEANRQAAKGEQPTGPAAVRAEAADVGVVLMALAGREGFDLLAAVAERHEYNQTREVKR